MAPETDATTGAVSAESRQQQSKHLIEWVWMWRCLTCGTVGSTATQAEAHRRLHSGD